MLLIHSNINNMTTTRIVCSISFDCHYPRKQARCFDRSQINACRDTFTAHYNTFVSFYANVEDYYIRF